VAAATGGGHKRAMELRGKCEKGDVQEEDS